MEDTKLIDLLKEHGVHISKTYGIYLNDVVEKIIESKNPGLYIERISDDDKVLVGKRYYYCTDEKCLKILRHGKSTICKKLLEQYDDLTNLDDSHKIILLKAQFKLSDNYRLKLESERFKLENERLKISADLKMKQMDLEIERIKTHQLAITHNVSFNSSRHL